MSKTKTPNIKSTSVPSVYDTPMTTLEYLRKVEEQNSQVLARQDEIEEALNDRVAKSGDTMTGALNIPQVNAGTGVFRAFNAVSQDGNTHVEANNNGFVAEVSVPDLNKKYTFGVGSNGKVALNVHDVAKNHDILFMFPNADDYEKGTYELATKNDIPEPSSGGDFIFSKAGVFQQNVIATNSHAILRLSRNMLTIDIKGEAYTGNLPTPYAPSGYNFATFTLTQEEMNKLVSEIDAGEYGNLCTGAFNYSTSSNGLLYGKVQIDRSHRRVIVNLIGNTGEWPSTASSYSFSFDVECILLGVTL